MLFQPVADLVPGTVEPTHHGADRNIEHCRRLVVGETIDIDELERRAQAWWERSDRFVDAGIDPPSRSNVLGTRRSLCPGVRGDVAVSEHDRALSAVVVEIGIPHDREEPRPGVATIEGAKATEGPEQGLLNRSSASSGSPVIDRATR